MLVQILLVSILIIFLKYDNEIATISFFGFRALVLITLAITMQLVKVVLLTKDIAVCASLGSKVQAVRKVIPIMPNRPLARV